MDLSSRYRITLSPISIWIILFHDLCAIRFNSIFAAALTHTALQGAVHKVRHAIFGQFWPPSPCHTLFHIPGPPESSCTSHISDPPIFSRPSTQIPDKSPRYKFYLNCSRRSLSGGFVRVDFCPFPLLLQYIYYNRKLNITWNFMFHVIDKKFISVTSHALTPSPCHKLSHLLGPLPLERDVLYGRPLVVLRVHSTSKPLGLHWLHRPWNALYTKIIQYGCITNSSTRCLATLMSAPSSH